MAVLYLGPYNHIFRFELRIHDSRFDRETLYYCCWKAFWGTIPFLFAEHTVGMAVSGMYVVPVTCSWILFIGYLLRVYILVCFKVR